MSHGVAVTLLAAASAAAGWALADAGHDGPPPATVLATRAPDIAAPAVPMAQAAESTVDHIEASNPSCEPADGDPDALDFDALALALTHGTEIERFDALMGALESGAELPPELLWQTYVSEPSVNLRLLAFTTYVDAVSHAPADVRAALQSAAEDASPDLRAEAERRLGELDRYEQMRADALAQGLRLRGEN